MHNNFTKISTKILSQVMPLTEKRIWWSKIILPSLQCSTTRPDIDIFRCFVGPAIPSFYRSHTACDDFNCLWGVLQELGCTHVQFVHTLLQRLIYKTSTNNQCIRIRLRPGGENTKRQKEYNQPGRHICPNPIESLVDRTCQQTLMMTKRILLEKKITLEVNPLSIPNTSSTLALSISFSRTLVIWTRW